MESEYTTCGCRTCELALSDFRRAVAHGWNRRGSIAPFLVALDQAEMAIYMIAMEALS